MKVPPRSILLCHAIATLVVAVLLASAGMAHDPLKIELSTIVEGNADWDWTQARTAYLPSDTAHWMTTMSRTAKVGAHGYHDVYLSANTDRIITS